MIPVGAVDEREDRDAEDEIRDLRENERALDVGMEPEWFSLLEDDGGWGEDLLVTCAGAEVGRDS